MLNINFVPDDYIQKRESMRANLFYLVLMVLVMAGLGGAFGVLKFRQKSIIAQAAVINTKMEQAKKEIAQLEDMQVKRKEMMKAALMTAELIEPVPRTVLLAELTNSLPAGVSLRNIKFSEKQRTVQVQAKSTYDQAKADAKTAQIPPEKLMETIIEIEGLAPSDIQVAGYIAQLNNSILLDDVALVLSKENSNKEESTYREFKLTASLRKGIHLGQKDIEGIRSKRRGVL
jgi:Tfp pilus assembly protein PilN